MKDVCSLNTYILPWKIGNVKPSMKFLNPFSYILAKLMMGLSMLGKDRTRINYSIHKKRPEFDKYRYKWFKSEEYRCYQDDEMICYWKNSSFEGTEAAFLMDVFPMSKYNFDKAIRIAYKDCANDVGALLYVGNLPFSPYSMIKVPSKLAPKNFHFVAKIMERQDLSKELVHNGINWDVNLASYDLL
jgi:hypothetical protein